MDNLFLLRECRYLFASSLTSSYIYTYVVRILKLLNVLRGGSKMIMDKDARMDAIQAKPTPTFSVEEDEPPIQTPEIEASVVLSTEAMPSPSQTQSERGGGRRTSRGRRRRGFGAGVGKSRRRRTQ